MSSSTHDYVKWFRQSSPYINAHRGKTFVLMLPGEGLEHSNFSNIIYDIALLNSLGVRLVLVHGARPQVDARLKESNAASEFHHHLRITDTKSLRWVTEAIGAARTQVEAALSTGLPNSPMHGARMQVTSGNFIVAMPHGVIDGVDLQHTGKVRRVNTRFLNTALDSGAVVLLSPLGYSATGEAFNLAFSDVAVHVASALRADKLVAFIEADGVKDKTGALVRQLPLKDCQTFMQEQGAALPEDAQQALSACYQCCLQGVLRGQVVSYSTDGAMLSELFTRDGLGTMVHADNYEQLRAATIDDVGGILKLLAPLEDQGILVRRSRELLETEIHRFNVLEKDGTIIACAALYPFGNAAELACMVTHPDYRKSGRASALLEQMEKLARQKNITTLFALTTQTAHWFLEHGFTPSDVSELPVDRQKLYNYQRNSKVFSKTLD